MYTGLSAAFAIAAKPIAAIIVVVPSSFFIVNGPRPQVSNGEVKSAKAPPDFEAHEDRGPARASKSCFEQKPTRRDEDKTKHDSPSPQPTERVYVL